MRKKILPIVSLVLISLLVLMFFYQVNSVDNPQFAKNFLVSAIYDPDSQVVEIRFEDKSHKTTSAVLEILGMEESFQKRFTDSNFVERVFFGNEPKYGWQIHPITILVEHDDFGKVGIKTEIYSEGDPIPPIIFTPM